MRVEQQPPSHSAAASGSNEHKDFHLFGHLEQHVAGMQFATDAVVKQSVIS
jgi:hypothetical protein